MSKKFLFLIEGYICIALGIIGFIMPIMPGAPFILIAAYCFLRGSDKAFIRLYYFPVLGRYVQKFYEGNGIPRLFKNIALIITWFCTIFTIIIIAYDTWQYILTISFAMLSTGYVIWLPTSPPRNRPDVVLVDGELPSKIKINPEPIHEMQINQKPEQKIPKQRPIPQVLINKNFARKTPIINRPAPQMRTGNQLINSTSENPIVESGDSDFPYKTF